MEILAALLDDPGWSTCKINSSFEAVARRVGVLNLSRKGFVVKILKDFQGTYCKAQGPVQTYFHNSTVLSSISNS